MYFSRYYSIASSLILFLCNLYSMNPINPKIIPPIIVAKPILRSDGLLLDSCINANPRINAENVVLI